jgi:hypothetical protein
MSRSMWPDKGTESMATGSRLSRRQLLMGAAAYAVLPPFAFSTPSAAQFFDAAALEKIADRDPGTAAPFIVDAQTHVWWREGGLRTLTPSGEHFLKALAGSRASVIGQPVPIADMGRMMFIEDMFLHRASTCFRRARRRSSAAWRRRASGFWESSTRPTDNRRSTRSSISARN